MSAEPTDETVVSSPAMPTQVDEWEEPLANLLTELSSTQTELLTLLETKRKRLVAGDRDALLSMQADEERLSDRLAACQERRQELLAVAEEQGLPSRNLRSLTEAMPTNQRKRLRPAIREARNRTRLLQHQSLTNWVLVQRRLLHLSQMVEIIATGGQKSPTYERSGPSAAGGALIDQAI